jgi:hypothetical protein
LTAFLNSKLFRFAFREYFPELLGDTRELSKIFFENVRALQITDSQNDMFSTLVEKIVELKLKGENYSHIENEIEDQLAKLYSLSPGEKNLLNNVV